MKRSILILGIILCGFIMEAQHRKLPVEDFDKKTKKELFDLYEQYNLKIANEPNNANPYFRRGWLKYYLNDTVNAVIDIQKAISLDTKNPFYHYAKAYIIIDKGEYESVVHECDEALKYDKTFVDVLVMRGSALDQLKKTVEARENYIKALQIDSTYEDIYIQFASSYAITNNFKEAEGLIIRLLKQYPNSEDGLKYKMRMFMHFKQYDNAITAADELIKSKRSLAEDYLTKSSAYDSLNNRSKACECMLSALLNGYPNGYEYIMKNCPKEQEYDFIKINTWQLKAFELEDQGRYEDAMNLYYDCIKLMPDSGNSYYNRGKLKRKMEDHKGAIEDYLIAIKKSPTHGLPYLALGVSYTLLGDIENAKKYYLKCMQVDPLNEKAYYNYADILVKDYGNYKEAVYYYKYAIDLKPDYTKAYYWLGETYAKLEMLPEACEMFKKAEKLGDVKAISQRLWYCR